MGCVIGSHTVACDKPNRSKLAAKVARLALTEPSPQLFVRRMRWAGEIIAELHNAGVAVGHLARRDLLRLCNPIEMAADDGLKHRTAAGEAPSPAKGRPPPGRRHAGRKRGPHSRRRQAARRARSRARRGRRLRGTPARRHVGWRVRTGTSGTACGAVRAPRRLRARRLQRNRPGPLSPEIAVQ